MSIFTTIAIILPNASNKQKTTGFHLHGLLPAEHPRLIHVDADHGEHLGRLLLTLSGENLVSRSEIRCR